MQDAECFGITPKNNGSPPPDVCFANPVNASTGNKYQLEQVYRGQSPSALEVQLSYNSYNGYTDYSSLIVGPYGRNWTGRYLASIRNEGRNAVSVRRPDGKDLEFRPPASGNFYLTDADTPDKLERLLEGSTHVGWLYTASQGDEVELYDAAGRLLAFKARTGLTTWLSYSGSNNGILYSGGGGPLGFQAPICQTPHPPASVGGVLAPGHLLCVTDPFGRQVHFQYLLLPLGNTYDGLYRVRTMLDPSNQAYLFEYDGPTGPAGANNLTKITFPDSKTRIFHYNEAAHVNGGASCPGLPAGLPNSLTGITDENGNRYATWKYDCQGRATGSEHALGVDRYTLNYGSGTTEVVDPLNTSRTLAVQATLGVMKCASITQPAASGTGTASSSKSYDANGNVSSRSDWNGNVTNHSYDLARNLETSRTEAFGTPQARTITTDWHASFRLPARVAEPLRITSYVYNGDGGASCGFQADGVTLVPAVLCSKTVQPTSDATGAAGFGATPIGTPRTWAYTYNPNGSVLTADGPRTGVSDVTTYTYYPNNDPVLRKRGNVATITNALGHVTSITDYNSHGQPLTIVDPNGLVTNLAYDPRQRITTREVDGEVTTYEYDYVGQLTKVILPDSSFLSYTYDAAHRLTEIADNLGNRVAYTLDAMGNRTQEQVFDPANVLAQTRSRVFNNLNRLFQEIGAQSQTTQYAYDNQGNLASIDGPLAGGVDVTVNQYDALNRLRQVTDPNSGLTQYGYNGIDQLVSVTDPRNLATTYGYDGLSNLNSQVSPDTGTTANSYDAAGNLLTQTDAKGQVTTYTYDALNRVTFIQFHDGLWRFHQYDSGVNGLGRLSGITEFYLTEPQFDWREIYYFYDQKGRTTSEEHVNSGNDHGSYTIVYSYDTAGRMNGMTYPSGRTVAYAFDALGRISEVSSTAPPSAGGQTQVIVSSIAYHPFGGVKSYTLGNGQTYTRSYDLDGRIASYTLGATQYNLGYDAASRIAFIAENGNPPNTNTYGYDNLDRLIQAILPNTTLGYGYDAVGNRLTKAIGAGTDTYTYAATSNRIESITPASGPARSLVFDNNGSTTNDGVNQYAYNAHGRMVQSTGALGVTTYRVNALGQRTRKTNSTEDRLFLYDMRGRLIAETNPGGGLRRELLYLNDIPLAVFQ